MPRTNTGSGVGKKDDNRLRDLRFLIPTLISVVSVVVAIAAVVVAVFYAELSRGESIRSREAAVKAAYDAEKAAREQSDAFQTLVVDAKAELSKAQREILNIQNLREAAAASRSVTIDRPLIQGTTVLEMPGHRNDYDEMNGRLVYVRIDAKEYDCRYVLYLAHDGYSNRGICSVLLNARQKDTEYGPPTFSADDWGRLCVTNSKYPTNGSVKIHYRTCSFESITNASLVAATH